MTCRLIIMFVHARASQKAETKSLHPGRRGICLGRRATNNPEKGHQGARSLESSPVIKDPFYERQVMVIFMTIQYMMTASNAEGKHFKPTSCQAR